MGLPDVHEWQQQYIDSVAGSLQQSQERGEEFVRSMLAGGFSAWFNMFNLIDQGGAARKPEK
jgi:hypothetical protein